jgi:rhomboid protease GluP
MKDNINIEENKFQKLIRTSGVTILLIAVNVIVFVILEILGDTEDAEFMLLHGADYPELITGAGEYWRFFTAAFLHFGFDHLINNMLILGCAGHFLEEALGHGRYLILYLVSAVASNILSFAQMYYSGDYAVSAGASGAVFAVIGGLLWIVIRHRGHYETLTTRGLLFMIALCLYYGISTAGIDNWSHLGGLASGFVLCVILYGTKPKHVDLDEENQYT